MDDVFEELRSKKVSDQNKNGEKSLQIQPCDRYRIEGKCQSICCYDFLFVDYVCDYQIG